MGGDSGAVEAGLVPLAIPFVMELLASVFSYLARAGATGSAGGGAGQHLARPWSPPLSSGRFRPIEAIGLMLERRRRVGVVDDCRVTWPDRCLEPSFSPRGTPRRSAGSRNMLWL